MLENTLLLPFSAGTFTTTSARVISNSDGCYAIIRVRVYVFRQVYIMLMEDFDVRKAILSFFYFLQVTQSKTSFIFCRYKVL